MLWAMKRGRELGLPGLERMVLVALCERARDGECWPSLPCIASDAGVSRRKAHSLVHSLAGRGLIRMEQRGRTMHYFVQSDPVQPVHSVHRSGAAPVHGVHSSAHQPVHRVHPDQCKSGTLTGAPRAPKPSKEPVTEPCARDAREPASFKIADQGRRQAAPVVPPAPPEEAAAPVDRSVLDGLPPGIAAVARRNGWGGGQGADKGPEEREPSVREIERRRQQAAQAQAPLPVPLAGALTALQARVAGVAYAPGRGPVLDRDEVEALLVPKRPRPRYLPPEYLAAIRAAARQGVAA
jgi:hypothetical protein